MKRTKAFTAHPGVQDFLEQINAIVSLGESNVQVTPKSDVPLVLIVGAPRSGTTVLTQWLAKVGFAVPGNLAARFSKNPYFAGLLQRLLSDPDLNFQDELTIPGSNDEFESNYGKTAGLLAPHEFSFYFRRFFPFQVGERVDEDALRTCDVSGFIDGLTLFGAALDQPVALKGLLVQYHLELFEAASNVVIMHVYRNEVDNICSLMRHRHHVAGDPNEWISVRPPQFDWLRRLNPVEQVAGQVHFTNREILRQLSGFPAERVVTVDHESFCLNPRRLRDELNRRLVGMGSTGLPEYPGPDEFAIRRYDVSSEEWQAAERGLNRVRSQAERSASDDDMPRHS